MERGQTQVNLKEEAVERGSCDPFVATTPFSLSHSQTQQSRRTFNKDASTPEDNAKAMGGTVDAARFNSKVSGMVIGTSPPDMYRDSGEFLGGSSSGAFPVEGRDAIKSQSDMKFGARFAERREASRAAVAAAVAPADSSS